MPSAAKTTTPGIDRDRLSAVIEPIARAHGAEVVDVELKSDLGGWVLRVYVEKQGSADSALGTRDAAVDLGLCADVARDLSPALDLDDALIPHRYNLEVSSPGVERALKTARDFARFAGLKAKVKLTAAVRGQKVLRGVIGASAGGEITICQDGDTYAFPLDHVESANLVFEFGPAAKPGGKQQKRK